MKRPFSKIFKVLAASAVTLVSVTPPKTFTPNGDGINDTISFQIRSSGSISDVRGRVFDLRGGVVAELKILSSTAFYWDGLDSNGSPASKGIYIYQLEEQGSSIRGSVVLAR